MTLTKPTGQREQEISAISILLSKDLWLSSQQALLDTALSFFLFLAVLFLLGFSKTKKRIFLVLSSCSWSLAFLSKGQPALIFLFFLAFFIFHKKINLWEVFLLGFVFLFISFLWLIPLFQKFGPETFLKVFLGFAGSRALESDPTQNAPVFWYARWLFESVRVGWVMFLVLAFNDFVKKKLTFEKSALLFYFFSSFFLFSFAKNKVWWYILPLVPIVGLYIYLSSKDYLKNKSFAFKIHLILLVSSLPVFYSQRNIIAVILLFLYVAFGFLILQLKISFQKLSYPFGIFSLIFALTIFYLNFPKVSPYYPEVKRVGEYYKKLSQPKCLYLENMPYESALFYTEAEEVNYFKNINQIDKSCNNYLLTPDVKNLPLVFSFKRLNLYLLK